MMSKEAANKKIIIRTKYILQHHEELQLAAMIKRFTGIINGFDTRAVIRNLPRNLQALLPDGGDVMGLMIDAMANTGFILEDEDRQKRIYTLYVHTIAPEKIIDPLLQAHAKKVKATFRFIEDIEVVL